ncbi:heme o synthase [Halovenus marina]|uniref:heme o synthase n=1 Tax=Halovenus marina TaxID=3396621 RepID=UPI003F56DB02
MSRFTHSLVAGVVGTYLLFGLGATTAATGAASFALGHYAVAVVVGGVVVGVTIQALRTQRDAFVQAGLGAATLLYLSQALVGMAGFGGNAAFVQRLHLPGGVVVFGVLLLTLVRHLECEYATENANADELSPTAANEQPTSDGRQQTDATPAGTNRPQESDSSKVGRLRARVTAYVSLTKPRLMWLLCLLALGGMGLATTTGAALSGVTVVATLAGGVLAIGASATFNHVYERERDSQMERTADRPVATQTVEPARALTFGAALLVGSMGTLLLFVNTLAALLTLVAAVYYAVVYTVLLKPTTTYNTVIGGGAGALPAVIGWAAVTGRVGLPALVLAAVVFCWTPAHFYNLAIVYREEYAAGGYPMLPVVNGVAATRRRICYWLGTTLVATAVLGAVVGFGRLYIGAATLVGGAFLWTVVQQYRIDTEAVTYRSFHASNAFLGTVLLSILVETMVL